MNNYYIIFLIIYCTFYSGLGQVNQLIGQASQQIPLISRVSLQYDGAVTKKVESPNEQEPTSWVGLGWKTGLPSFIAFHNNTVDLQDDKWYIDDGFGNMSEIIGITVSTTQEKFVNKQNPLQKIAVIDNNPPSGQPRLIKGWRVTNVDGTISRYGYVEGKTEDAMSYLPYWGNAIISGKPGYPAPGKYYYRWYLKETEDINHNKTQYNYTAITAQTPAGFTYTKETYPFQIITTLGQKITYELDPNSKNINEGPLEPLLGDFDISETRFLRKVFLTNPNSSDTADRAYLKYSGDPGEVLHIKSTERGFAKRLLTGIDFKYDKSKNQQFEYSTTDGTLRAARSQEKGSSIEYTYENKNFLLSKNLRTDFELSQWDNTDVVLIGNHVFCLHYNSTAHTTIDKFEIYSKVQNDWVKDEIPGITGTAFSFGAKIFPYVDRFVIHFKIDDNNSEMRLFQWIDNRWQNLYGFSRGSSATIDLEKTVFQHAQTYVLQYNPNLTSSETIDVIGKIADGEAWGKIASFNALNGASPIIATAKNYFLYSFLGSYNGVSNHRQVNVYRNDGNGWAEHLLTNRSMYQEGSSGCQLFAFDDYFVVKEKGSGAHDIAIRRWDPASGQFEAEFFENTNLQRNTELRSFTWPRKADLYCGNDYMVLIEPDNDDYMMIYRYLCQAGGSYQWNRTYIAASGSCPAPAISNATHSFTSTQNPTPQLHEYAKDFQHSSGNIDIIDIDKDGVQCSDRHFTVRGEKGGIFWLWDFRWIGDKYGPVNDGWISTINNYPTSTVGGEDDDCQGFQADEYPINGMEIKGTNPDNLGIYLRYQVAGVSAYEHENFSFNYKTRKYERELLGGTLIKISQGNDYFVQLCSKSNINPYYLTLFLSDRYLKSYLVATAKRVSKVTNNSSYAKPLDINYNYENGGRCFNKYGGYGLYSLVSTTIGDGTLAGTSTTEFCLDSSIGVFGQVFGTTQHSSSIIANPPVDDTVRISGWLMELDGYTPKMGWVGAGGVTGAPVWVKIDPQTGYFQTKFYNPSEWQFGLWYASSSVGGDKQAVFYLRKESSYWILDYLGKNYSEEYDHITVDPYNWQNVKLNYGIENGWRKTVWNKCRRLESAFSTYNFYGKKIIPIGTHNSAVLPRLVRSINKDHGVTRITESPLESYDEHNNVPSITYTIGNNSKLLAKKTLFGHDYYSEMNRDNLNMLTQSVGSLTYAETAPGTVSWESSIVYRLAPEADPYTIPLLNSLSDLKINDRIMLNSPHELVNDNVVDQVTFKLKVNNAIRVTVAAPAEYYIGNSVSMNYKITSTDLPITSLSLVVEDVDYTLDVGNVNCTVYKDLILNNTNVVSASATTYETDNGIFRPDTSYAWVSPMNSSGLPTNTYSSFEYENPASNLENNWNVMSSIERYSGLGQPVQVNTAGGPTKTTITGTLLKNKVASITNAHFKEASVFTGDYDFNQTGPNSGIYFDLENGWSKGANNEHSLPGPESKIVTGAKHFGEKGISVKNAFGPTRVFKLEKNKDYILSAWIKPVQVNGTSQAIPMNKGLVMDVNYRKSPNGGITWPIQVYPNTSGTPEINSSGAILSKQYGDWYFVKLVVPAKKDITDAQWNDGYQYAVVWVGCPNGNGVDQNAMVNIDDIRFYPKNAMVTSTFYNQNWYQPMLSIDANNNPGKKVEYDGFGRPVRWYKVNGKNPSDVTLLQEKEYHFMGDFFNPNPNKWYKIVSDVNENFCIDIEGPTWTDGQNIHLWTYSGTLNQLWKFVPAGDGYYNIVSKGGPTFSIDDPYGNITNGTQLKIWTATGDNQKWKLTDAGEGFCRISAKASDAAFIDLENGNASDGSKLQIWNSGTYNRWKLVLVE